MTEPKKPLVVYFGGRAAVRCAVGYEPVVDATAGASPLDFDVVVDLWRGKYVDEHAVLFTNNPYFLDALDVEVDRVVLVHGLRTYEPLTDPDFRKRLDTLTLGEAVSSLEWWHESEEM